MFGRSKVSSRRASSICNGLCCLDGLGGNDSFPRPTAVARRGPCCHRRLDVKSQHSIAGISPAARAPMSRLPIAIAFCIGACASDGAARVADGADGTFPMGELDPACTSCSPVSIQVSQTRVGAPIDGRFAGLSFEKGMLFRAYFTPANTNAV